MLNPPTSNVAAYWSTAVMLVGTALAVGLGATRRDGTAALLAILVAIALSMLPSAIQRVRYRGVATTPAPRWKRPEQWYNGITLGGIVVALTIGLVFQDGMAGMLAMIVAAALSIVAMTTQRLLLRRLRRRLIGTAGLLCPKCQHLLWALESPGRCPECGTPFTFRSAQEYWARSMDMPELVTEPDNEVIEPEAV